MIRKKLIKKTKKKKGFTLIELLAVILILGIIALIAVPTVNNIIKQSRENAAKRSIENYVSAVEQQIVMNKMDNDESNDINDGKYTIEELKDYGVTLKGDYPESGYVRVIDDEVFYLYANMSAYTIFRSSTGEYTIENRIENVASDTDCYNIKLDATDLKLAQIYAPITANVTKGKTYRIRGHVTVEVLGRSTTQIYTDFVAQSGIKAGSYALLGRKVNAPDNYEYDFDVTAESNANKDAVALIFFATYQNINISVTNFTVEEVNS